MWWKNKNLIKIADTSFKEVILAILMISLTTCWCQILKLVNIWAKFHSSFILAFIRGNTISNYHNRKIVALLENKTKQTNKQTNKQKWKIGKIVLFTFNWMFWCCKRRKSNIYSKYHKIISCSYFIKKSQNPP